MIMNGKKGENDMTEAALLPPVNSEKRWLRYREMAEKFGVCQRTIRREVDEGKLPPPEKMRGCVRFDWVEVVAFLLARKPKGT
jgi:predicted DNA-binding transcriptional regulator AlpA